MIAHAALGFDVGPKGGHSPLQLATGTLFSQAQVYGVVQADFFDWPLEVPGGEAVVSNIARRVAQFDWASCCGS